MRGDITSATAGSFALASKNCSMPWFCFVTGMMEGGTGQTAMLMVAQ